jgi:hypothetical protein
MLLPILKSAAKYCAAADPEIDIKSCATVDPEIGSPKAKLSLPI